MNVTAAARLVTVLLAVCGGAVAAGFLLARAAPCGVTPCDGVQESGTVTTTLGDGSYRHVVLGGRPIRAITPGANVPVNVSLTNPNTFAVTARRLTVRISDIEAPRSTDDRPCSARDFTISQAPADLTLVLPARTKTTLGARGVRRTDWPAVHMLRTGTNQDGCKAAAVELRYTAVGRQDTR